MNDFTLDFRTDPYALAQEVKEKDLLEKMKFLTAYHKERCPEYAKYLKALGCEPEKIKSLGEIPMLPVGLFKMLRLSSLDDGEAFKSATSSGTTGQRTSQVILDGETRTSQQLALAAIGGSFLGRKRLPMLVIDCEATVSKRDHFSARTAGIQGFSLFGRDRTFVLRDDMTLNVDALEQFLSEHGESEFLVFGFTFMVWKNFCLELEKLERKFDLSHGILIHGGGWKKLISEAVSKETFHQKLKKVCGLSQIHDYYGMAEQTGSIFVECECGRLHVSDFSGVLIRRAEDFSLCEVGEKGIIQVMSVLPRSYPGHSILTEDEGALLGVDDCPCGRKGVTFAVFGRLKNAELRGCSDTYAADI